MSDDTDEAISFMDELYEHNGVVCSTVSDGTIIRIKRSMLEKILAALGDKDDCVLFIKRPDKN